MDDQANSHCLNCGTALAGPYCTECGQKDLGTRVDLRELVGEFVSETFEIEGRLPRTLFSVLFKPGEYLFRYLEGQRRSFSSPLRFYLLAVFLSVLVTGWRGERAATQAIASGDMEVEVSDDEQEIGFNSGSEARQKRAIRRAGIEVRHVLYLVSAPPTSPPADHGLPTWWGECEPDVFDWMGSLDAHPSLECIDEVEGFLESLDVGIQRATRSMTSTELTVRLFRSLLEQIPAVMSVTTALFALVLKAFWWRHPTTVHVLLAVTFHALVMYGVALWMVWPTGWMAWLVHGWLQVHALFGLKAAYRSGWLRTFLAYFALAGIWGMLVLCGGWAALMLALWQLGSMA